MGSELRRDHRGDRSLHRRRKNWPKPTDMQRAFHEDAIIFGFADGSKFAQPNLSTLDSIDQEPPATGTQGALCAD